MGIIMDLRKIGIIALFTMLWSQLLMLQWRIIQTKRSISRRWWVRPVNRRKHMGFNLNLFCELMITDHEEFFRYTRMWPEQFEFLLNLVHPYLEKRSIRKPLSPRLRLGLTLTYLAQGESMRTKHLEFRVGKSTVCKIIPEVCHAIWCALQPIVLPTLHADGWKKISEEYMLKWQFPNCIGALDGRHMEIKKPPCSGSQYHNYKKFFSIVLLVLCDANYKFTWVDIGQFGSISDGGVWRNSELAADLASGDADIPPPIPLPGRQVPFPHVIVADEAFPLNTYLMRPYAKRNGLTDQQRVFNYRLSRTRLCVENTFGILVSRWHILHKHLCFSVKNAENVIKALVCLHNFIMSSNDNESASASQYCPPDWLDVEDENGLIHEGQWRPWRKNFYAKVREKVRISTSMTVA